MQVERELALPGKTRGGWMYDEMSDVEESKVSCGHAYGSAIREGQNFDEVPQSWASWITVDDGRTVEQVRMDQSRIPSTAQTAARLNTGIENPALLQQMNLFMQIDEVNDEQDTHMRTPASPASSLPNPVIKRRRNNNISKVPPAQPLTRKTQRRLRPHVDGNVNSQYGFGANTCPISPPQTSNNVGNLSGRSRGPLKPEHQPVTAAKLGASSRRERHSIGEKLKKAFGVRPAAEPLRLGEKTAKLLHAVDCMNKSNIQPAN